jgi:hypothetical protein
VKALRKFRTPVLVIAAALFGASLSAAVLVGFWDDQVQGRRAVEARLAASQDKLKKLTAANATVGLRLHETRVEAAKLRRALRRLEAQAKAYVAQSGDLVASAGSLHGRGGTIQTRAASVSKLATTLGHDVAAAVHYITTTPLGSLDPAYLKAQLDYLEPAAASIRSAADSLGGEAGSYASAVDAFAAQAQSYAAAVQGLAKAAR